MVISGLKGNTVFIDSAPLIYFIEGHTSYQSVLATLFKENDIGSFSFITSTITLLEVLVLPIRLGRGDIATQYQKLLTESSNIEIIELTTTIAARAAQLRATYNLKTPDSIQLATAMEYNADYFLTNDVKLKNIDGINILTLHELSI